MPLLTPAPPVYYIKWVICPPLFNTTVVLLNFATTMISACGCFLELLFAENHFYTQIATRVSSLWKEKSSRKRKLTGLSVSNCELNQRVNCGWHYVFIRGSSVRLKNVCHTCTDVSSIPHIVFLEHGHCEEDHGFCESTCLAVCHLSLWHVLRKPLVSKPWTRQVFFTRHLYFVRVYFLPS